MSRSRPSAAGGFLIALGALGGTIAGYRADQPSAGFLIGVGAGALLSVLIWLWDRRR